MANGTFELGQINITSPNGLVTKPISIDNSGNPLFNGIQLASTVNPTFTGNVILPSTTTVNSKLLANSLLAEYTVTGSAVTSVDFTGLDINTHKSYRMEIDLKNATGTYSSLSLFINTDINDPNYRRQLFGASGTTVYGNLTSGTGGARITEIPASGQCSATINVSLNNGYPLFFSTNNYNLGAEANFYSMARAATVTNINELYFIASVANSIGVGSTIRLYRGDV